MLIVITCFHTFCLQKNGHSVFFSVDFECNESDVFPRPSLSPARHRLLHPLVGAGPGHGLVGPFGKNVNLLTALKCHIHLLYTIIHDPLCANGARNCWKASYARECSAKVSCCLCIYIKSHHCTKVTGLFSTRGGTFPHDAPNVFSLFPSF